MLSLPGGALRGHDRPLTHRGRRGLPRWVRVSVVALAACAMASGTPAHAAPERSSAAPAPLYLVQFDAPPLATYAGGVGGIGATRPAPGGRLDRASRQYAAYRDHLRAERTRTLGAAGLGNAKTVAEYDVVLNGAGVRLTGAEVTALARTPGVRGIWKQEYRPLDTTDTPAFLGMAGPDGTWARQFGDPSHAGEGVIVGVVDSGVSPGNPSFAPLPEPRPDAGVIAKKWTGGCAPAEEAPVTCTNKLIGARWYNFGKPTPDAEYRSPRDYHGHGSHVASTAAGNHGVEAVINGVNVGTSSGMAPAARLAMYKACWMDTNLTTGGCGILEQIKGIDDAVADGVDVLNLSISGSPDTVTDPIELALFNAAAAGVFVAASGGNSGPGASTVAHNSPWVTTAAAGTHDRAVVKAVTLGDGTTYTSAGSGGSLPQAPLVDAAAAPAPGSPAADATLCKPGSLDPATVTGTIVLCARGDNARTDKSRAVKQAGGVGMILYNPSPATIDADVHFVPTVHVGPAEGAAVKAYIAGAAAPTASMAAAVKETRRAPQVWTSSSAGPALAGGGDLLKPDVLAPGAAVIAAVAPEFNGGNDFASFSGTSMASSHVAGVAALLKQRNPAWTPMMIKSALMTTAGQTDNTGAAIRRENGAAATPLDHGAGHLRPGGAFDPGLVYDSGPREWARFVCGSGEQITVGDEDCAALGPIDSSDLNYPSIAVGDLAGRQTVTRTVRNSTGQTGVYVPKLDVPTGYEVTVTPQKLTVRPEESASYTVEITHTGTTYRTWSFGSLTWSGSRGHSVRSPIALRAVPIVAPDEVRVEGAAGDTDLTVVAGHAGTLTSAVAGLTPAQVATKHLVGTQTGFDSANPAEGPAAGKVTVVVPAGGKVARFATYDADVPAGTDLDLYVYRDGALVGRSVGLTAEEAFTTTAAGRYDVYVVQYATATGVHEQDVRLHAFVVGPAAAGNLTVTPAAVPVTPGRRVELSAAWSGLSTGTRYLGVVEYGDGSAPRGTTLVSVTA
ncbi:S8 family serine peptidase [Nonomuraea sp. LPB2021202275-12-8]|uniref:S8 family serine peptidase n=1 Tax=Nonomuraea sp. LPB2021202275-12-8 TaxID=3120159 RepID=UPI00300CA6F2